MEEEDESYVRGPMRSITISPSSSRDPSQQRHLPLCAMLWLVLHGTTPWFIHYSWYRDCFCNCDSGKLRVDDVRSMPRVGSSSPTHIKISRRSRQLLNNSRKATKQEDDEVRKARKVEGSKLGVGARAIVQTMSVEVSEKFPFVAKKNQLPTTQNKDFTPSQDWLPMRRDCWCCPRNSKHGTQKVHTPPPSPLRHDGIVMNISHIHVLVTSCQVCAHWL